MPASPARLLQHLRRFVSRRVLDPASDAALLERYIDSRDEAAFAALVERHGPMVLRLCRGVLADSHAAEDAFQATFLVLARRAPVVHPREALAGWLHGVAYRVALKARTTEIRRRSRESPAAELAPSDPRPDPLAEVSARELLTILDEEVRRLPATYRLPVLLCCLEGRTQEEAARQLGWTPGSLKGRLERGRAQLQARLARRGFTLSAALALVGLAQGAAAVPAGLVAATVKAASALASGSLAGAGLSADVVKMVQEASKGANMLKLKVVTVLVLVGGMMAAASVLARLGAPARSPQVGEPNRPKPEEPKPDAGPGPGPGQRAQKPGLRDTLGGGHTGWGIAAVAYSPDGKTLASTDDESIKLWDLATGRNAITLRGLKGSVTLVAYSPDGKTLAAASNLQEHTDKGTRVAGWVIKLWDPATGKNTATLQGKPWRVRALAFSPDSKTLASAASGWDNKRGGESGQVQLWDVATGKETAVLEGHETAAHCLAFSPEGKTLLAYTGEERFGGILKQWDVGTRRNTATVKLEGPRLPAAAFSPDGKTLALGSCRYKDGLEDSGEIQLWDVATGQKSATFLGHKGFVQSLAFSPDGKTLASGGEDQAVLLWNLAAGKSMLTLTGEAGRIHSLAFSPDGKTLTTGSGSAGLLAEITVWDLATGKQTATLGGHLAQIFCLAFHPDGKTLISGSNDKTIRLWELPTGKVIATLRGYGHAVMAVAVSPDGKTLASGNGDNSVQLWDFAARKKTVTLKGHTSAVVAVAFSPDGKILASGNGGVVWRHDEPVEEPGAVRLWDAATGKEITTLRGHKRGITSLSFSPDGKTLASGSAGQWNIGKQEYPGEIKLWDVAAVPASQVTGGTALPVGSNRLAFCSGGKILATGVGSTVTLWDVATRKKTATLEGHTGGIAALACSPDGKLLASASGPWGGEKNRHPGMIKLWDTSTGKELATLEGHTDEIAALAFGPDGRTLASGSSDRTIKLWDVPSP